ncbi:MAG: hypothetical protein WD708_01200 [Kiritimatiellia bacterium]
MKIEIPEIFDITGGELRHAMMQERKRGSGIINFSKRKIVFTRVFPKPGMHGPAFFGEADNSPLWMFVA